MMSPAGGGGFNLTENAVFDFIRFSGLHHVVTSSRQAKLGEISLSKEPCMRENKLADLSITFAVNALRLAESVEGHYSLKNQFERSATSIGANIREANYAQSRADFLSKLQIALKECYETEYWLELFTKAKLTDEDKVKKLLHDCGELRLMLVSSVNTLKNK
jgi:four helix bundle protein